MISEAVLGRGGVFKRAKRGKVFFFAKSSREREQNDEGKDLSGAKEGEERKF